MSVTIGRRGFLSASAAALISARAAAVPRPEIEPSDYDALTDEQLGASNRVVRIATQPAGEWYGMGISSYQGGDEGYRWQIGWWLQPLAITQYRLPAYRELYRRSFEGFIAKMAHRDTWSYWEAQSTGMAMNDSLGLPGRSTPTADPIARDNINYSANTMNLMAMHEMFYRQGKYLQPNSFVLKHWTRDKLEVFPYDLGKVARTLYDGFAETGWRGVACEVNGVYPAYCNQLALVGFKQFDQVVPGDLGARLVANHTRVWRDSSDLYKMGAHVAGGPEPYIPRAYYVKQDTMVAMGDTMITSAAYVNAWYPEWVAENYPYWKKRFSVEDDVIKVNLEAQVRGSFHNHAYSAPRKPPATNWDSPGQSERGETPPFYYYAAISAAEMGDASFRQAIENHCRKFGNGAKWRGDEFGYERNELTGPARVSRGGAVLLTASLLVQKDGFRRLYNQPWTKADQATPQLEQVGWPELLVRRAVYDPARQALVLTLLRSEALQDKSVEPKPAKFVIANLDVRRTYEISRDGGKVARIEGGQIEADGILARWEGSKLAIEVPVGADTSFVIRTA